MVTINASRFVELLELAQSDSDGVDEAPLMRDAKDLSRLRIPTGPWDIFDPDDPNDNVLEVTDTVDLRGRKLTYPVFVYGVRFRGRVDLREMTIQGGVDLTACVFDEELRLDDTEIEGSLRLIRIAVNDLSMNGIIVHGRLNLRACEAKKITMFDASVDGFVDLRSLSCRSVRLKGAHIRSDLRIGCGPDSGGQACRLRFVDASGSRIDGRISIDGCGYAKPGTQSISAMDKAGNTFHWPKKDTSVRGLHLDLSLAKVGGSLQVMAFYGQIAHFDDARERGVPKIKAQTPVVWPILKRLDLTGAVIDGDVVLLGTLVTSGIDARGVHIGGQLCLLPGKLFVKNKDADLFRQTEVREGKATMGAVDLRVARIDGEVIIEGVKFRGNLDLSSSTIGSYMCVRGFGWGSDRRKIFDNVVPTSIVGDLFLYLATIENPLELLGTHITRSLSLWGAVSPAHVRLSPFLNLPCRVDRGIDLHSARLLQFELQGTTVLGRVRLDGCEMLYFAAGPGRLRMPSDVKVDDRNSAEPPGSWMTDDAIVFSEVGHLLMRNGNIVGDMELEYLQVTGQEIDGRRGLIIEDSEIGGSLLFFGEAAILRTDPDPASSYEERKGRCSIDYRDFSAVVFGDVQLKRTLIGAGVEMSAIKVDGVIDFEDSSIGADLRFTAVRRSVENPAVCNALILRMIKCTNDVDLTGLVVVSKKSKGYTGGIDGRYASVSGDLKCYDFDKKKYDLPAFTRVESYLDLSYSQLAHLVISGNMFANTLADEEGESKGLLLIRAKVGKLEVSERYESSINPVCSTQLAGSALYPNPLCLTDVNIEAWDIFGAPEKHNDPKSKYINFLLNDKPFRRSTYRSLENNLRSRGDDRFADALYCAMYRQDWEDTRHKIEDRILKNPSAKLKNLFLRLTLVWGAGWRFVFRFFLQYGTDPNRLLWIVIFLFLISLPVYHTPANFEPSLEFLAVPSDHFESRFPPLYDGKGLLPPEWTPGNTLEFALKNHVPIVPLQVREEWQPKEKVGTIWSAPIIGTWCLPVSPEGYCNFMQLISWVCWPLLLTFYIKRLLRHKE